VVLGESQSWKARSEEPKVEGWELTAEGEEPRAATNDEISNDKGSPKLEIR